MENMEIYNKVRAVPKEALKTIGAGRLKGMSDINPMWRIEKLTETFGICGIGWRPEITKQWLEQGADNEIRAFCNVNLYVKVDGEWSEAIPGTGGSSYVTMERNGAYVNDECFKMAYTDALSVACKSLGIGADVYFASSRTKYTAVTESTQTQPQQYVCAECGKPFKDWTRSNGEHWTAFDVYSLALKQSADGKARCSACKKAYDELHTPTSVIPDTNA